MDCSDRGCTNMELDKGKKGGGGDGGKVVRHVLETSSYSSRFSGEGTTIGKGGGGGDGGKVEGPVSEISSYSRSRSCGGFSVD